MCRPPVEIAGRADASFETGRMFMPEYRLSLIHICKQVVTHEAVQTSVAAYKRYILDKLGITRDELLNNFILSKYRYEDFLSSSDTEKNCLLYTSRCV